MHTARFGGKEILIQILIDREGYSYRKAARLVRTVIQVIKNQLLNGKNVKIEGLGTLTIVTRKLRRDLKRPLKRGPNRKQDPSIVNVNKHIKSIKLKNPIPMKEN
jgi:nucleoid DNA-binding protein